MAVSVPVLWDTFSYNFPTLFSPWYKTAPVQHALYDFMLHDEQLALGPKTLTELEWLLLPESHDCKEVLCSLLPNQLVKIYFDYCVLSYFHRWCLILHWANYLIQYRTCHISCLWNKLCDGAELSSQNVSVFSARAVVLRLDDTWINCQRKTRRIVIYWT